MKTLKLGTRGSALALAQSRQIGRQLEAMHPGLQVEERIIRTTGDNRQSEALPVIGGKGVFTLEIETALLNGDIDFAVHSLKDLPPDMPAGLNLVAVPKRASANDVLVVNPKIKDQKLKLAAVGTSSLRRKAMLLHANPHWEISDLRGNIDTRLRKLEEQNFDAIVLARAGLERLELLNDLLGRVMDLDESTFIPAPGQGALAIQARIDDPDTWSLLRPLDDDATRAEITAERAVVRALNAGCSTPLGARATANRETLSLTACVLSLDGTRRVEATAQSDIFNGSELGANIAENLLTQGARELLA